MGDNAVLLTGVQSGLVDGVLGLGRNLDNVIEDIDVMQSTAEMVAAGKILNNIASLRNLVDKIGSSAHTPTGFDSDQDSKHSANLKSNQRADCLNITFDDDDEDLSKIDEILHVDDYAGHTKETVRNEEKQLHFNTLVKENSNDVGQNIEEAEIKADSAERIATPAFHESTTSSQNLR